jgi:hypothetical protein
MVRCTISISDKKFLARFEEIFLAVIALELLNRQSQASEPIVCVLDVMPNFVDSFRFSFGAGIPPDILYAGLRM